MLNKRSYISKEHGEYCVHSEKNKNWSGGCYKSKDKAKKRLQEVEYFKHMKGAEYKIPPYEYMKARTRPIGETLPKLRDRLFDIMSSVFNKTHDPVDDPMHASFNIGDGKISMVEQLENPNQLLALIERYENKNATLRRAAEEMEGLTDKEMKQAIDRAIEKGEDLSNLYRMLGYTFTEEQIDKAIDKEELLYALIEGVPNESFTSNHIDKILTFLENNVMEEPGTVKYLLPRIENAIGYKFNGEQVTRMGILANTAHREFNKRFQRQGE